METKTERIISIEIKEGKSLRDNWKYPMMVIYTDEGNKYLENVVNHPFAKWDPHTELIRKVGQLVEFEVRPDSNHYIPFMKFIGDGKAKVFEPTGEVDMETLQEVAKILDLDGNVLYDKKIYAEIANTYFDVKFEVPATANSYKEHITLGNLTKLSWNQMQRIYIPGINRFTKQYNLYKILKHIGY